MRFTELHETVPYAKGGKEKVLKFSPYPNITLAMPGRHALDTVPVGGDFVVMVNDDKLSPNPEHQFTHTDIFKDVESRQLSSSIKLDDVMSAYFQILTLNADIPDWMGDHGITAMSPTTFLQAVQCLAVAEHRRYAKFESRFGGRYLPFRFAAGIAEGLWSAADAANLQRKGRPGVEMLEKKNGTPVLTKELMNE